jgi:hypothetical protein
VPRNVEDDGGHGGQTSACATGGGDWGNDHAAMFVLDSMVGGGRGAGAAIIAGCVRGCIPR